MSFAQDVLDTLTMADAALRNSEIREAMHLPDTPESTTRISGTLRFLRESGSVERIQIDGAYAYQPTPAAATRRRCKARKPAAEPQPAISTTPEQAVAMVDATITMAGPVQATPEPASAPRAPEADDGTITISRRAVRLLVAGVLVFGDKIGPDLRGALKEAVEAST